MKIIWKSNGSTKYYTKNEQHEPTKRRGWTKVILVEKLVLAPHVPPIDFTNILLIIRIGISKKNRHHNGQKKRYKRTNNDLRNTHETKDRVCSPKFQQRNEGGRSNICVLGISILSLFLRVSRLDFKTVLTLWCIVVFSFTKSVKTSDVYNGYN
jgi:hypothetical protein